MWIFVFHNIRNSFFSFIQNCNSVKNISRCARIHTRFYVNLVLKYRFLLPDIHSTFRVFAPRPVFYILQTWFYCLFDQAPPRSTLKYSYNTTDTRTRIYKNTFLWKFGLLIHILLRWDIYPVRTCAYFAGMFYFFTCRRHCVLQFYTYIWLVLYVASSIIF